MKLRLLSLLRISASSSLIRSLDALESASPAWAKTSVTSTARSWLIASATRYFRDRTSPRAHRLKRYARSRANVTKRAEEHERLAKLGGRPVRLGRSGPKTILLASLSSVTKVSRGPTSRTRVFSEVPSDSLLLWEVLHQSLRHLFACRRRSSVAQQPLLPCPELHWLL